MQARSAHIRSNVMGGPGDEPLSLVSTPVTAGMPRVASRISLDVTGGADPAPRASLRIAIVPPVKRITIIQCRALRAELHRQPSHPWLRNHPRRLPSRR